MSVLTQTLLIEKNEEIDELTSEVGRLNNELEELRAGSRVSEVRLLHQLNNTSCVNIINETK